jgi:hypothetical protein
MTRPRAADDFVNGRATAGAVAGRREKALAVSETPRYPRRRKPENDPAGKPEIGLFRVRYP